MLRAPNWWLALGASLALALALVMARSPVPGAPPDAIVLALLVAAVPAAALATAVALRVREWAPAAVSAGSTGVAGGLAIQLFETRPVLVPVLLLAAACFAVATVPWAPVRAGSRAPVVAATCLAPAGILLVIAGFALVPHEPRATECAVMAGAGAGFALVAALHGMAAFRLLRVRSWLIHGIGAAGLASSLALMGAGVDGMTALAAFTALLPPLALASEARARPGLRTYVLGGILAGALRGNAGRDPARAERALVAALHAYSPALADHLRRTSAMAARLGVCLGLNPPELDALRAAALFHDVGKLFVPVHVLDQHGQPHVRDWQHLHAHPAMGQALIGRVPAFAATAAAVGDHHEKYDGSGYPAGKRGPEIHLFARILTLADVYDALISDRPYKAGWAKGDVIVHIRAGSGSHFDPEIAAAFIAMVECDCHVASDRPGCERCRAA